MTNAAHLLAPRVTIPRSGEAAPGCQLEIFSAGSLRQCGFLFLTPSPCCTSSALGSERRVRTPSSSRVRRLSGDGAVKVHCVRCGATLRGHTQVRIASVGGRDVAVCVDADRCCARRLRDPVTGHPHLSVLAELAAANGAGNDQALPPDGDHERQRAEDWREALPQDGFRRPGRAVSESVRLSVPAPGRRR